MLDVFLPHMEEVFAGLTPSRELHGTDQATCKFTVHHAVTHGLNECVGSSTQTTSSSFITWKCFYELLVLLSEACGGLLTGRLDILLRTSCPSLRIFSRSTLGQGSGNKRGGAEPRSMQVAAAEFASIEFDRADF